MLKRLWFLAALGWAALASAKGTGAQTPPSALPSQLVDPAPCVSGAAQYHRVNPWVLRAILKVESDFNPRAVNHNANGTLDVGIAQINSIHFAELRKWGVAPDNLMDGCTATYVAAWHLARQIRKHGNSWYGVASYHSASPCENTRYARLLWNALVGWRVVAGPRLAVASQRACGYGGGPIRGGKAQVVRASASPALAFDEGRP